MLINRIFVTFITRRQGAGVIRQKTDVLIEEKDKMRLGATPSGCEETFTG